MSSFFERDLLLVIQLYYLLSGEGNSRISLSHNGLFLSIVEPFLYKGSRAKKNWIEKFSQVFVVSIERLGSDNCRFFFMLLIVIKIVCVLILLAIA